uniref:HECT-type E3 ubiquitin transferase n=1 Tax=Globisporangium ultimum (strain ATCC 200006 / CBS 805.95 / DAOM BR144) TaxID=431595 RepID=K3X468_GLOUD
MIWFWELVREMPNEYRRRLLHFATGLSRVPIAGFSALTSYNGKLCPFTLKDVKLKDDGYIWSHACFNRLDLSLHVVHHEFKAVLYAAIETDMYGFTTD